MGAWDYGIWDNDTALDLKVYFETQLLRSKSLEEAFEKTYEYLKLSNYQGDDIYDIEEEIFALVDLEIEHDVIQHPDLFRIAKKLLINNKNLVFWDDPKKREKELNKFLTKILEFEQKKKGFHS